MTTKTFVLTEDGVTVWSKTLDLSVPAPAPTPEPTPTPAPTPTPSPTPTPGAQGPWYDILTSPNSYVCDQLIKNPQGEPWGLGHGFFKDGIPPAVYMPLRGTLYFIINPGAINALYTGRRIYINVTDFDQTPSGCEAQVVVVDKDGKELIPMGGGFISAGSGTFQMSRNMYNYQPNQIYIVRITEAGIRAAYLSVNWN